MVPITEEDADESLFPMGKYDEHNQQIDLRTENSWIYQLDQVLYSPDYTASMLKAPISGAHN